MTSVPDNTSEKISFEKLKELDAYFDEQLKEAEKPGKSAHRSTPGLSLRKIAAFGFGFLIMFILPFLVLIRSSVYLYSNYSMNGWLALSLGVSVTIFLLLIYAVVVNYSLRRSAKIHKYLRRGIALLVIAYCGYGLIYFSAVNAKSAEVKSYYQSLHPIMRVTMATTILINEDIIVTDMHRTPDDYRSMGLPVKDQSLHYPQKSGYVHAVDIRTKDRPEWKNLVTEMTFELFGMNTLRHVGTADHLHISLPLND